MLELEAAVVRGGFKTPFREGTVQDLAIWMLGLAREGLDRRNFLNGAGVSESHYLLPLLEVAESGQTFAEQLIQNFSSQWQEEMKIALPAMCRETFS